MVLVLIAIFINFIITLVEMLALSILKELCPVIFILMTAIRALIVMLIIKKGIRIAYENTQLLIRINDCLKITHKIEGGYTSQFNPMRDFLYSHINSKKLCIHYIIGGIAVLISVSLMGYYIITESALIFSVHTMVGCIGLLLLSRYQMYRDETATVLNQLSKVSDAINNSSNKKKNIHLNHHMDDLRRARLRDRNSRRFEN